MGAVGTENVTENRGMFNLQDNWSATCTEQTINFTKPVLDMDAYFFAIAGDLKCNDGETAPYVIMLAGNSHYEKAINANGYYEKATNDVAFIIHIEQKVNRTFLTFASDPDEHYFGFGEQFTYFDMQGKKVPIWVSEQGVGRGEQPITFAANLTNGGAGGNAFTTYAPLPFYISSNMRSFNIGTATLNAPSFSSFDFRKKDRVQVETWSSFTVGEIRYGQNPAGIIENYTFPIGHMDALPEWVYSGAIVGMQGGTQKVEQVYTELRQRNTPIAAFWLQDWVGQRTTSFGKQLWWNWEVDYDHYPGWDEMAANFKKEGIRVMVYTSPYLADIGNLKPNMRRNLFQEAKDKGYLVKNREGEPYLVLNTDFYFGIVDLTNLEARRWYKSVLKEQVAGSGASGWMADFGEGLPYDAVLSNQLYDPGEAHNEYPSMWAKLNHSVVYDLGGDFVFFNRAASARSLTYAPLFWEGDQLVDWSAEDGIKSAVTGLNTSGLSGMAFNHSDIGGYTTISNPILNIHRSRELLYRWMEMNAFTLIFRTHEGNQPDKNIQFYTDDETLDTFAYWAKVYAALFDYRKQLVQEATETGLPVVRHPFIHYPDDPETWKITYQEFMLGRDFLIAPVTDPGPGADQVKVYLPAGRWIHVWTGQVYEGGQYLTIAAPLGQPAVFYVEGSQAGQDFVNTLQSQGLMP